MMHARRRDLVELELRHRVSRSEQTAVSANTVLTGSSSKPPRSRDSSTTSMTATTTITNSKRTSLEMTKTKSGGGGQIMSFTPASRGSYRRTLPVNHEAARRRNRQQVARRSVADVSTTEQMSLFSIIIHPSQVRTFPWGTAY